MEVPLTPKIKILFKFLKKISSKMGADIFTKISGYVGNEGPGKTES